MSRSARRTRPSQAVEVWHVYRFAERFELPDDARFCRRGPLVYCRDFVAATDDESATYLRQIDSLSRRQNGLELEGAWSRIRRAASSRSRAFRGYLLTLDNRPASDAEIGRTILFCEARRAARILKSLAEIGLIEQARCPLFDLSQNVVTPATRKKTPGNKANRKSGTSGRHKSVSREATEKSEKFRGPLRAKKKPELTNGKRKEEKETGHLARKSKPHAARENQGPLRSQGIAREECRHSRPEGERQPAITTPPRVSAGTRIVPLRPGGDAAPVGNLLPRVVDALAHGYTVQAPDFAREIFGLLRPPFTDESRDGVRELANYRAALLEAIDAGLSPGQIEELMGKAKSDAARIGKHRKRHHQNGGTPERYWRFLFNKHLNARRGLPAPREKRGAG